MKKSKKYARTYFSKGFYIRTEAQTGVYGDNQQSAPDALIDRTLNTYDGFNRLTKVEKAEAGVRTIAEYVYNGDDLRVRKTVKKSDSDYAPEITYFLYDRQYVILETDGSGNTAVRYIRGINYIAQYSKATDVGGSRGSGTSLAYYLYNGHGDVVQTVTAAGEVQNRYDYDIFGNPTLTIETTACNIRYAGEYLDNETGLYYLRARYYDPSIGRFISEDSYWGEDTNPLSLNLYTYAYNNPIRFIDPTGHSPYEDIIANARKQAQTNSIIKEINKQKDIWFKEEQGSGKNQKTWTNAQTEANRKAEALRQQLAQLESGNADIQKLIKDDSKAIAGAWEGYQLSVTARLAEANPDVDYSDTIRRQAQDYALAEKYGRNAIGIDASMITEETRTAVERFAESVVGDYQGERTLALLMKEMGSEFNELSLKAYAYNGDVSIYDEAAPGAKIQTAEDLLNDLLNATLKYKWDWFKTKEQNDLHTQANNIRDAIKQSEDYENDPLFKRLVNAAFDEYAYENGNTKEEIQALLSYLQGKAFIQGMGNNKSYWDEYYEQISVPFGSDIFYGVEVSPEYARYVYAANTQGIEDIIGIEEFVNYYGPIWELTYDRRLKEGLKEAVSFAVGFTPADFFKDSADLYAGKDIITGDDTNRMLLVVCLVAPELFDKVLKGGLKQADDVATYLDDAAKGAAQAGKVIPDKVTDVVGKIKSQNGAPPQGYKGGGIYRNQPVNGVKSYLTGSITRNTM